MPVIGPHENTEQVNQVFEEIWALLQSKYKIQYYPLPQYPDYSLDRIDRKNNLKEAIRLLFELESWESF